MSRVRIIFGDLEALHRKMRKVMDEVFTRAPLGVGQGWRPAVDIYEDADKVVLLVELAGVEAADVEVTIGGSIVRIAGSRRPTLPSAPVRCYQLEIDHGSFERLFRLPVAVDDQAVSAVLRDGYLRLELPKRPAEPRAINVERT